MENEQKTSQCPFLGEIVMEYCQAYPVRKPIPKHQITTATPCSGVSHQNCPLFAEIMARLQSAGGEKPGNNRKRTRKEVT